MAVAITVEIIDLELRLLVALRAADGEFGTSIPPMQRFDELLDHRLTLAKSQSHHEPA
jgi:hypothetical protein